MNLIGKRVNNYNFKYTAQVQAHRYLEISEFCLIAARDEIIDQNSF
jgi:hypothetical protein